VQLPTSTTATAGAQNTSSVASAGSIFKASGGSATGKKSLLPTFAAVLAQQADGKDADEQVSQEIGRQIGKSADQESDNGTQRAADGLERGEAAMLAEERALGAVNVRAANGGLPPFARLLSSDLKNADVKNSSVEQAEQTSSAASHKSAARSGNEGHSASGVTEKKPDASISPSTAASMFMSIPVAAPVAAAQQMPVEKRQTVQKSGGEPGVPASVNMLSKTGPNAGVSAALDSANGKEYGAHTMADSEMEAAAASKPESQGANAAKGTHANEASNPSSVVPNSTDMGAQSASAQEIASQLRPSYSDAKTPSLPQVIEGAGAAAQAAAKTAGQAMGVPAAAAKSKLQQKGGGNAAASAVSSSANFAATVSPRSNPAASGAEFAVRANDAVNSDTGKTSAASDESLFQRLDSGETPVTLLHSSAHQIAVGVHDPSLGWVEVQTQSAAGHISATLSAASTDAHANLTAQMPAMTQYLADRNVSLHSLNVDTQGSAPGGGQPQHSGSGSESSPGRPQPEAGQQSGAVSQGGARSSTSAAQDSSATGTVGASHISVRA